MFVGLKGNSLLEMYTKSSWMSKKEQQAGRHLLTNDEQILRKLVANVNFDGGLRLHRADDEIERLDEKIAAADEQDDQLTALFKRKKHLKAKVARFRECVFSKLTKDLITCSGGSPFVGHQWLVRHLCFLSIFAIFCRVPNLGRCSTQTMVLPTRTS